MTRSHVLRQVDQAKPCANDLLRGWHDAEKGFPYDRAESADWQMGWRLWHDEYGRQRSSHSWH
jgi:hypothetical protein